MHTLRCKKKEKHTEKESHQAGYHQTNDRLSGKQVRHAIQYRTGLHGDATFGQQ